MSDVARTAEVAAVDSKAAVRPVKARCARSTKPMVDRCKPHEVVLMYAGMAVFLFFILTPFIEGFVVSLKPLSLLFSTPYSFWPKHCSFDAYFSMWRSVPALGMHVFNSFFISTVVTLIVVVIVVPAAYAFARFQFPGSSLMLCGFLAVNMFSGAAFLIPSSIWLLRTYMMRIPRELDKAAWVDGASRLYTLRRVVLPPAMPGIVVVAIMTFIGAYAQQFIFALTFNSKTEFMPLPVGLFAFFGKQEVILNELMAASFVGILPVTIVIVFPVALPGCRPHRRRHQAARHQGNRDRGRLIPVEGSRLSERTQRETTKCKKNDRTFRGIVAGCSHCNPSRHLPRTRKFPSSTVAMN